MSTRIRNMKAHNYSKLCKVRRKFRLVRAIALVSILALLGVVTRLAVVQAAKPDYYVTYGEAWCHGNTVWTDDGNIWDVDNPTNNDINEGARVRVLFSDNGTSDNIYDDVIIDVLTI